MYVDVMKHDAFCNILDPFLFQYQVNDVVSLYIIMQLLAKQFVFVDLSSISFQLSSHFAAFVLQ